MEQKQSDLPADRSADKSPDKFVTGANQLAHFNVRCPSCSKLFRIDSREIKSASPHFDCSSCKTRFTFDFPPSNVNKVETRMVTQKDTFQLEDSVDREALPEIRKCPKCSALNPRLTKECLKCGVIFEKVESLPPADAALGAIPSLVKAWQDLMGDYDNLKKHVAFVDRCEDLQALPFALKKYQSLKEAQPQDDVARQMFHQVLIKNLQGRAEKMSGYMQVKAVLAKVNWVRVRKLAPVAIPVLMIMSGLVQNAGRNMVGLGAALLFLPVGITVFVKCRLSPEDFW